MICPNMFSWQLNLISNQIRPPRDRGEHLGDPINPSRVIQVLRNLDFQIWYLKFVWKNGTDILGTEILCSDLGITKLPEILKTIRISEETEL